MTAVVLPPSRSTCISVLAALCLITGLAYGGTVGKLAGKVTDKESGDPVIGANVVIDGTTIGASADADGEYYILNVPPGFVTIRVSALGYAQERVSNVQITSDQTTTLHFKLASQSLQGEEVTIVAERKLVQTSNTFGTATVAAQDIQQLPVTNLTQVIELQAGIVDGHFRGGRSGEVLYLVDGVSVTDAYNNSQGTQVDNHVVDELQVITGTFNAEYGQAMSGVVNTVIKEGSSQLHASASAEFGDYLSGRKHTFQNIDDYSPLAIQDYSFSVSGPVPRLPKLSYSLSARYMTDDGWQYGKRVYGMEPWVQSTAAGVLLWPSYGDSGWVPMNTNLERNLTLKLAYQFTPAIKVTYTTLNSSRNYRDYDYAWRLIPDANLRRYQDGRTHLIRLNHTVSSSMFYEIGVSNSFTEYHHWLYEDPFDARYAHPAYANATNNQGIHEAGNNLNRFRRYTNTYGLMGNISWQANKLHLIKMGVDAKFNKLLYQNIDLTAARPDQLFDPSGLPAPLVFEPAIPSDTTSGQTKYMNKPHDFSFYIQDKFEIPSLIINFGLRFDYLQPDGRILKDPKDPDVYAPLSLASDTMPLEWRLAHWYNKPAAKSRISPRLGIAFPMSDQGVFHFAYGHFVQWPTFERMYTNPNYHLNQGVGLNTVMGNSDLKMEETVTYELGFEQQIAQDIAIGATLYSRDIRNLVATDRIVETYSSGTKYAQFINRSFGAVKGITLTFDKRYANNFSVFGDYTYQTAEGDASDPQSAYNALHGEHPREPEKQLVPLNWDRRHTLNAGLTYSKEGPRGWGASVIAKYGSGTPYTPTDRGIRTGFENSDRKPSFYNLDLSAYKAFPLPGAPRVRLLVTLNVLNLLDTANEDNVFASTGRAGYTAYPETEFAGDGRNFSRPRMVKVGLKTEL
jgi:outer membrane receptor for ferrienterochelin and colicin